MDQQPQPDMKDFFGCMFAGDQAITQLKQECIILMGKTRVGKSTVFNYLHQRSLMGKKISPFKTIYESMNNELAPTGAQFTSVTVIPNHGQYPTGPQIGIIDMAGFYDKNRSYVQMFAVSYMLKRVFNKVKRAKILLTIDNTSLSGDDLKLLCEPFLSFIQILNIDCLLGQDKQALKENLFKSVSILVTKAKEQQDFYLYQLQQITKQLNASTDDQKILIELLKSIYNQKRLAVFQQAKDGQQAPPCRILQELGEQERCWQYFDYEATNSSQEPIFKLPFNKQYQEIPEGQKQNYLTADDRKNREIKQSCQILKKFVEQSINNWNSINNQTYLPIFQQIKTIVNANPYRNFDMMMQELGLQIQLKQSIGPKCGIQLLQKINKIAQAISAIQLQYNQQIETSTRLIRMKQPLLDLYKLYRQTYCITPEQQKLFLIFTFINIRSLHECAMMNEINSNLGSSAIFSVGDNCQKILPLPLNDIKAKFINQFIPKPQELDTLSELISNFKANGLKQVTNRAGEDIHNKIQLKMIQILIKKGQKFFQQKNYKQALNQFILAGQNLDQFKVKLANDQTEINGRTDRYIQFRIKDIIKKIASCLQLVQGLEHHSIQLYKHINAVQSLDLCYKKLIKQQNNPINRKVWMQHYAKFNSQYCRPYKAVQIYQQILDEFIYMPNITQSINNKIQKALGGEQAVTYKQSLGNSSKIEYNKSLINEIKAELQIYQNIGIEVRQKKREEDLEILFNFVEENSKNKNNQA